jgi:hypothetical protein
MTGGYPLEFSPKKFPAVNIPSSTNGSPTTYDEVVEMVGTELPDGFRIKVGKTTLCRYYKSPLRSDRTIFARHVSKRETVKCSADIVT